MTTLARLSLAAVVLGGLVVASLSMEATEKRREEQRIQAEQQEKQLAEQALQQERLSRLMAEVEASSKRDRDAAARIDERRRAADIEMAVQMGVERALENDREARRQGR